MEEIRGQWNVRHAGHFERLSIIERLELRELVEMIEDQIANVPQDLPAFGRREISPASLVERMPRRGDRMIDVLGFALGHLGDGFASGGIEDRKCIARAGVDPFTVDEHLFGTRKKLAHIRIESIQNAGWQCGSIHIFRCEGADRQESAGSRNRENSMGKPRTIIGQVKEAFNKASFRKSPNRASWMSAIAPPTPGRALEMEGIAP
jgi:hypothetical protein